MADPDNSILRRRCFEKDQRIAALEAEVKKLKEDASVQALTEAIARADEWRKNHALLLVEVERLKSRVLDAVELMNDNQDYTAFCVLRELLEGDA